MRLFKDFEGDLWVQTLPERLALVLTKDQAERMADSGYYGGLFSTVDAMYGPLVELDTTSSASRQQYLDTGHYLEKGEA